MLNWLKSSFKTDAKLMREAQAAVPKINALEPQCKALTDEQLRAKTTEFKERLSAGETLNDLLPEAFAVVREAARRTLGQRHFDVQLIGGFILHHGGISEMRTGEGKTLVATLPAYLNALEGKGVHVVTVNDYLSRRDAVWMGQIYDALGCSVGILNHETSFIYDPNVREKATEKDEERDETGSFHVVNDFLRPATKREAYAADITYGTNNEYGFDYLRDNVETDPQMLRQREYHYAIIDEIDSILIDEARTPLIISAPVSEAESLYERFAQIASSFKPEEDYTVDEKHSQIALTDAGIEKAEKALGVENLYTEGGIKFVHHLETAVRAKALFTRDKSYVIRDGQVVIVDEFTGRMQPGRRWSEGLHQAIEAKEGVRIQQESRTFASITFQNYFRLYKKLSGMTGTALTSSEEFYKVYGLHVSVVPTNKPVARLDRDDLIFQTEKGKFSAIAKKIKELQQKGQPVLVGTASVDKSELLSAYLKQAGVPHEILNAKNHEREGEIIAQAGRKGGVTIATNMAGRGVDIKLGGNPAPEGAEEEIKNFGGLFVLGTERHEARRTDNQLRGRSGRQGDPGETQFYVSLEDSLMRIFASDLVKRMMNSFGIPEDEPIHNGMITRALEKAQTRIEEIHFDARKHVLAFDDVLSVQRKSVYARRRALLTGGSDAVAHELQKVIDAHEDFATAIELKKEEIGDDAFYATVRRVMLQATDLLWMEHLETMDYVRSSVNLRAYGQRDPLVEYKKESLRLFREMEAAFIERVGGMIPNIGAAPAPAQKTAPVTETRYQLQSSSSSSASSSQLGHRPAAVPTQKEYGRNDKVKITNGTETEEMKYKKAEARLATGQWRIVE